MGEGVSREGQGERRDVARTLLRPRTGGVVISTDAPLRLGIVKTLLAFAKVDLGFARAREVGS